MFAILAIVCMFTFVLSSGLGGRNDVMNMIPEMFGGSVNSKNPTVATIDGKRIDGRMVEMTRVRRRMANDFMDAAFNGARMDFVSRRSIVKDLALDQQLPRIVSDKIMAARFHSGMAYDLQSIQTGMPPQPERELKKHLDYLTQHITRLKAEKRFDEAKYLESLREMLEQDKSRISAPLTQLFFGGALQTGDDIIDFLVWKREADRRKIQIAPETLTKMINQEILGEDATKYQDAIVEELKKVYRGFKESDLLEALTDEFRVRIVQGQLLGESGGLMASPAVITPYEFRKYFNDECKSIRTALLPLDVESYLAQVTETPSDSELKELFDKYKKDEANPGVEQPGFMTPKHIKLEYVGGKPDTPYFRNLGQQQSLQNNLLVVGALQSVPQIGGNIPVANWLTALSMSQLDEMPDARIRREYEQYRSNDRFRNWTYSALFFFNVHDTSVVRPENIAATIADLLASRMTGGAVFAPCLTLNKLAIEEELRSRVRLGLQTLALVGSDAKAIWSINEGLLPQPLPFAVMREKIADDQRISVDLARKAFMADFNKFLDEMKKKAKELPKADAKVKKPDAKEDKKPDPKAEMAKLIDDFVKKHHLTHGVSKNLQSQYTLLSDEGLKDLKDRYFKNPSVASDKVGAKAAAPYFTDAKAGLYSPIWFGNATPETATDLTDSFYVTWTTEETEPKVRTFQDARADVIAAWKLNKARVLAEAAAKKLQEKVAANKDMGNLAVLRDFASENKTSLIELDPIAKMKALPLGGSGTFYLPGRLPTDKIEYSDSQEGMQGAAKTTAKLLELREKSVGDTVLIHDEAKRKFYVAILLQITVPEDTEFQQAFTKSSDSSVDMLYRQFDVRQRNDYRKTVMAQLRSAEKVSTVPEELKRFTMRDSGRGGNMDYEE